MVKKRAKRKKAKRKSAAEKAQAAMQRRFRLSVNTLFKNFGFHQIATRNKEVTIEAKKGDLDALFFHENIIVISEDTCAQTNKIKDHVNKTGIFYTHLETNKDKLFDYLRAEYPTLDEEVFEKYDYTEIQLRFIYATLKPTDEEYVRVHDSLIHLSNTTIKYFLALSRTIHRSGKYELFKFLKLELNDIGIEGGVGSKNAEYDAFVLPETPSGFPRGYKVVTFYIDPKSLIERAYVLRKDGWQDRESLYQRMLIKNKIKNMRSYLSGEARVFINNLIVSLPDTARFIDSDGGNVPLSKITKAANYKISLPSDFDSIGIIDGQHRLFCYYEGIDQFEPNISKRRVKQQLLITGVIFPKQLERSARAKFEAKLFLEINDKQSKARADLKQAIETIVSPLTPTAIAKSVISGMAKTGPLSGYLEDHFFGDGVIKTSSIVSYGLRHIVTIDDPENDSSLISKWPYGANFCAEKDDDQVAKLRQKYVSFCVSELNKFISGFKSTINNDLWTAKRTESRVLSTTTINGLIFCFKALLERNELTDFETYKASFSNLKMDFRPKHFPFKSSHWRDLGKEFLDQCFS